MSFIKNTYFLRTKCNFLRTKCCKSLNGRKLFIEKFVMDVHAYLEEMIMIQENHLEYLDNESNTEELYQKLAQMFNDKKIRDSKYKLQSLLHLISKVVKNHHRLPCFFMKIEKIILIFEEDLKKYFSNSEIFNIFKSNKRILLFLIEKNLMTFDEYIAKKITLNVKYVNSFYPQYFKPEILPYKSKKVIS